MPDIPNIDIRPDLWEIVRGILQKHVPQYAVWAFGSRAKWTAKEYSDLDLAIITDKPLSLTVSAALADDFSESDLPWKVDVVDWATTSESFRQIIERDKVVLQEAQRSLGMAGEWRIVPLSELTDPDTAVTYGVVKPGPEDANGVLFIRGGDIAGGRVLIEQLRTITTDVSQQYRRTQLRGGEIVVSLVGNPGQVAIVLDTLKGANIARQVGLVRLRSDVDTRFVRYFLSSPKGQEALGAHSLGSVQQVINLRDLKTVPIPVPPLPEQRAIAHILGTLDDKIELNRKQNETLEAMARALFKAWFVDFEPVRAKMEGRWQRDQSLPGLPAHLYDLFPDRLVESELGEIPEGWGVTSLSEFSSLNPESWTKRTRPEQIQYVDLSNTKWGRIESVTSYEANDAPSRAQRVLRPLDTIIGTVRPGNGSYALISDENLTGSTGFAVLRPLRHECSAFVYLAATARENIERLSNLADGGAYPAVRPEIVSATQVPRIRQELINDFSRQVSPMLAGIAGNERTSRTLTQLRDTLLPKLISGELRLPEISQKKFEGAIK